MTRRPLARSLPALLGAAVLLAAPAARAQTFDFDAVPFTTTPFTLTSGGVSAAFGTPGAPFFEILAYAPGTFAGLSGRVLGDATADVIVTPLGIDFSTPLSTISLSFALTDVLLGGSQLTLDAFLGLTPVGTATVVAGPGPAFPEGTIGFTAPAFDRVVLSSDAADFAIDNVVVRVAAIPEPATVGLLGGGLLALAAAGARRRGRAGM